MGEPVKVYIYDLSKGMARSMSRAFLGKQIDGIWHTGIVVFGQEFYFGGLGGIESCSPGGLEMLGPPDEIVEVGKTEIPFEVFMEHLRELATTTFRGECYHLLDHNCNSFSNELALFLTGNPIPSKITNLPNEVLSTPFGSMIRPMLDSMQVNPGGHQVFPETSGTNVPQSNVSTAAASTAPGNSTQGNQYFPKTVYYTFDAANLKAIISKTIELNPKAPSGYQVREILIEQLEGLAEGKEHRIEQMKTLQTLLQWPSDLVFPALDILRLSIRFNKVNDYFCAGTNSAEFIDSMINHITSEKTTPANHMLALRVLCNAFQHPSGEAMLLSRKDKLIDIIVNSYTNGNKNIIIAASSLVLNYAVVFYNRKDSKAKHRFLSVVDQIALNEADVEAKFRLLVSIATLLFEDDSCYEFFKYSTENLSGFVKKCMVIDEPVKVKECASLLSKLIEAKCV